MKPHAPLLLALALSTILVSACGRDSAPNSSPSPESEDLGDTSAANIPTVDEPAPATRSARARTPAPVNRDSGMSFTDLDKNMDSGVTRDELAMTEMLHQHFNEADTSRDGKLSYAEIERHRMDMALEPQAVIIDGRTIFQMDKDGDGGVSLDELWNNEMLFRHFDEADRDQDGRLSAAEIDAHRAAMATGN